MEDQHLTHVHIDLAQFASANKFLKGLHQALHGEQVGSHLDVPKCVEYDTWIICLLFSCNSFIKKQENLAYAVRNWILSKLDIR